MRYVILAVFVVGAASSAAQVPALQFEVASIKRNTSDQLPMGAPPNPATGEVILRRIPARNLILQAYPLSTLPLQIVNAPSWAGDTYDVIAKGKPNATSEERQQMFRSLLAERMKLSAHYETRTTQGFNLVVARPGVLGPRLKPSTLDCSGPVTPPSPPPPGLPVAEGMKRMEEQARGRCGVYRSGNAWITGGARLDLLVRLITPAAGRPVVDKTGLDGYYAFDLSYQQMPLPAGREPLPDDPPALSTALQEQLGLKLESASTAAQILVIDNIERPSEN